MQTVSKPIGDVAKQMEETLADSAEKTAGLRKLLEAKDCFVRAALPVVLVIACLFGCMAPDVSAAEPQRDQYGATIPADGYEVYNRVARDNRPGDLAEAEYRYLRDNMPRGDGLRGLTTRELEAIDPWYRENSDQLAFEQTYGGYTYDQLGSYAGSATKEEHEASVRAHERAEAVQDAQRRADANARKAAASQSWKPKQPLPSPSRDEADSQEWREAEVAKQARKAKKNTRGKSTAISPHAPLAVAFSMLGGFTRYMPAEAAILFPRLRVLQLIWNTNGNGSACANGQCGVSAIKPLPLPANPLPSATKPVKPIAPKPTIVK